jgi:hypothetical protein
MVNYCALFEVRTDFLTLEAEDRLKIFKSLVCTSKRTLYFFAAKINWLMLFKKIIVVYSENHIKPKIQNTSLQIVKIAGA